MAKLPIISPATGQPIASSSYLHTLNGNFVDYAGRTVLLRGVNLSGSSKAPVDRPSQLQDGFWENAEAGGESFVGRPLNLDDGSADIHLARLRGWGFNVLRYPVTWEALEHEGPGKYDSAFMDYTVRVLRKCKEHGFRVYMDPHQDIWSRFSGGSGAPFWTLAACGINPRNFTATQAAIIHCEYPSTAKPDPASFPAMIWSTNYGRLASQTLFTLFFSGKKFAPLAVIDGRNIQDYLQEHFIAAFGQLADRIAAAGDLLDDCVIGWDSMNEPYEGLCGYEDLRVLPTAQGSTLKKGTAPTPAQSLCLGMGQPQTVENWKFGSMGPSRDGTVTIDPQGRRIWTDPSSESLGVHPKWGWSRAESWKLGECIWAQHGVWDVESGYMLRPDYFRLQPEEGLDFIKDFWRPHWSAYASRIRKSHPEAILFVAPPVFAMPPEIDEADLAGRCCYSTHYYDGLTLITRHWNWFNADALGLIRGKYKSMLQAIRIGESAIRKSIQEQLGVLKSDALILGAQYPTIIGEIGIPYDMDDKRSYGYTDGGRYKGDYTNQQKALDASLNAADGPNALNYTAWTYCPDSSHMWGDGWDLEDLSIWSADDLRSRNDPDYAEYTSTTKLMSQTPGVMTPNVMSPASSSISIPLAVKSGQASMHTLTSNGRSAGRNSWDNAFDFLTDGARAVKAFARPYPLATVGVPDDIQFSIAKAEFSLTVRVTPDDGHVYVDEADTPSTEVFIPLVHFAATKYATLQGSEAERTDSAEGSEMTESTLITSSKNNGVPVIPVDILDADIRVSAGSWSVDGQILKWKYPIPRAGEPAIRYHLTVRRKSGPLRHSNFIEAASPLTWLDALCPTDLCSIM